MTRFFRCVFCGLYIVTLIHFNNVNTSSCFFIHPSDVIANDLFVSLSFSSISDTVDVTCSSFLLLFSHNATLCLPLHRKHDCLYFGHSFEL
ncbi:unnamed protein product [Meloidogyne enterolobii]|uniref:Uncharacterized protein n=1 Tax=Meloidogyne enterolobii TaxID=390850 RepID=A0ACB1AU17_MELEN